MAPFQTHNDENHIKIKRVVNRRRLVVSGLVVGVLTFFATTSMLLLFALMFAPQLSNALWGTNLTQSALYSTSQSIQNTQIAVNMTATALKVRDREQDDLLITLTYDAGVLDARAAEIGATDEALQAAIVATRTAEVMVNSQQRTQAAVNYNATQLAINQQSTLVAAQATQTQEALGGSQVMTVTATPYPFMLQDEVIYTAHPEASCDWQGIAGQVLNRQGALMGAAILQVRVTTADDEILIPVTDMPFLDVSYNWGARLGDQTNTDVYFLRLETITGEAISPMTRIVFDGTCNHNLAIVTFAQVTDGSR